MDNKNLFSGNTALAPKYKPYNPSVNEELENLREAREKRKKALAQKNLKAKVRIIVSILLAFSLGVVLVLRYSAVYNLQKQLLGVSTEMHNLNMENENLKVQLIKASDMQQVEQVAVTELHMVTPDKNNIIYIQDTKDYFSSNTKEATKNTNDNLIVKIKNLLF